MTAVEWNAWIAASITVEDIDAIFNSTCDALRAVWGEFSGCAGNEAIVVPRLPTYIDDEAGAS